MNEVKKAIYNNKFSYEEPWFYNYDYALRCALGIGDGIEVIKSATERAKEIIIILFNQEVDCFFVDQYIYEGFDEDISIKEYKSRFSYDVIENIEIKSDDDDLPLIINRYIFYPNINIVDELISINIDSNDKPYINMVSFENECIFTIYDDRGCDIVFFDNNKYLEMYNKLSNYLLEYDIQLMKERINKVINNQKKL